MPRVDGRQADEIRPVKITPDFIIYPEGSVLIEAGNTKVICNASAAPEVPLHLVGKDRGWVTAEYSMLPRATHTRSPREVRVGGIKGRTYEIQRLIGRSLRASTDLSKISGWTFTVDCDVIQADGGTRTAAITGGFVALRLAFDNLMQRGMLPSSPVISPVAAISVGLVGGYRALDLDYGEDSRADVDFNVVANTLGQFIEVQGTAEGEPFERTQLDSLLDLANKGLQQLFVIQREALAVAGVRDAEASGG